MRNYSYVWDVLVQIELVISGYMKRFHRIDLNLKIWTRPKIWSFIAVYYIKIINLKRIDSYTIATLFTILKSIVSQISISINNVIILLKCNEKYII
jgi:hypothetical protein